MEEEFKNHDEILQKNILPRLDELERQQKEYNLQLGSLKNEVGGIKISQQDLKLTVTDYGKQNVDLLNKVLEHSLGIKSKQIAMQHEQTLATNASSERLSIAKLSTREKIIASLLGVGGLAGLFLAIYEVLKVFIK